MIIMTNFNFSLSVSKKTRKLVILFVGYFITLVGIISVVLYLENSITLVGTTGLTRSGQNGPLRNFTTVCQSKGGIM